MLTRLNSAVPDFGFDRVKIVNESPPLSRDIDRVKLELEIQADAGQKNQIDQLKGETDTICYEKNRIYLDLHYGSGGQERYGKIYKVIDPDKKFTSKLTRTHVSFKSES
jgi:hypothetical protein